MIDSGRSRLANSQFEDGRIPISPSNPGAIWPTPLAILAWHGSEEYGKQRSRAIDFLLATSGKHWTSDKDSASGHDTSIEGWPWTLDTHSWVEPTSLSILALRLSGFADHPRVREGVRLLMDRQLPLGGWNYGNTITYGKELYSQPDCTGLALCALAGIVPESDVKKSMRYLQLRLTQVRTPLSLGWGVLGLAAWGMRPGHAERWLEQCVRRQATPGPYDTTLVSLLFLALSARKGFASMLGG